MGREHEEPADRAVRLRHEHRVAGRLAQQLERPLQRLLAHRIAEVRDQGHDVGHVVGSGLANPDRGTHAVTYTPAVCRLRELMVKLWRRAGAPCGYWVGGSIGSGS